MAWLTPTDKSNAAIAKAVAERQQQPTIWEHFTPKIISVLRETSVLNPAAPISAPKCGLNFSMTTKAVVDFDLEDAFWLIS